MAKYKLTGDYPLKLGGKLRQPGWVTELGVVDDDHPAAVLVKSGRFVRVGDKATEPPTQPPTEAPTQPPTEPPPGPPAAEDAGGKPDKDAGAKGGNKGGAKNDGKKK